MIDTKINNFLEDYKVDTITFKQNQATKSKTKSNQENENFFCFTTIYVSNPSLKFQKRIKPVFQKYNIEIKPAYTAEKCPTISTTKANARKLSIRMSFTNILALNISYVGETSKQLFRRIKNHKEFDKNSATFQHIYNCKSCQNTNFYENFKV